MNAAIFESLPFHFKLKVKFQDEEEMTNNLISQLAMSFDVLESVKETVGIEFYSVTLMNLEQIFIELSKKKFEEESPEIS